MPWPSSTGGQGTATVAAARRTAASRRSAVNPGGGGATHEGQPQAVAVSRVVWTGWRGTVAALALLAAGSPQVCQEA
jgi:hypothetical protein